MSTIAISNNIFKPRKNNFLLLAFIFSIGIFVGDAIHSTQLFAASFSLALLFGIIGILFLLFTFKNELSIDNNGLLYKTLFSKKEIAWHEITDVQHQFVWHGKSGYNELTFHSNIPKKSIHITTNYYSRKMLQQIAELLVIKIEYKCSQKIKNMAVGKFPWYVF